MRRHLYGVSKYISLAFLISLTLVRSSICATITQLQYDDYPATAFGCAFEAKELGERVKATGADVRSAKCLGTNSARSTYSLSVSFNGARHYPTEDTYAGGDNFYGRGWYTTLADCEADLPQQVVLFQLSTGLEPFISYCSKQGSSYSTHPYWPFIQAMGKGDLHLNSGELSFGYIADINTEAMEQELIEGLSKGARQLAFSQSDTRTVTVGYYSISQDPPEVLSVLRFNSASECQDELQTIKDIYNAEVNPPFAMVCGKGLSGTPQVTLIAIVAGSTGVRADSYYDYYSTKKECLKNLPDAIADVKTTGAAVLGGVCSYYYGYYMPYTFQRR